MNRLEGALKRYDGKTTATLSEIRAAFGGRQTFPSDLVRLAAHDDTRVSEGATWLIKDLLDGGARLTPSQTEDLLGRLDAVSSWQAQLHICQAAGRLETPAHLTDACADWLTSLLQSDRPFLRAWSMDALQHLASRSRKLAGRAEAALAAAEQDPAASVRARARNWRKRAKRR